VNKVYIAQATFFMAVAACIQHCIEKCAPPLCFFRPPATTSWRRPCLLIHRFSKCSVQSPRAPREKPRGSASYSFTY